MKYKIKKYDFRILKKKKKQILELFMEIGKTVFSGNKKNFEKKRNN